MQSHDEQPQLCERCEQQPATAKYTHANLSGMLCATCLDRMAVQDALEDRFIHIAELERSEHYDEALACLDEILEANRHRDHEQWLARSTAQHRAWILFEGGRYAEAEQACKAWAALGFEDAWYRLLHSSVTANTLCALGRPREGMAVLEDALSYRDPKYLPAASSRLEKLAEIAEKLGQPVDPKWRSLAEEVAAAEGVEMPQHESLGKAILELGKAIRKKSGTGDDEDDDLEPKEPTSVE
jgi:tetratricopeptide (TPR) repeat protein